MTSPNQFALLSPADLQKLVEDSMRKVLTEKGDAGLVGARGVKEAAAYLGVSRRSFYYLLKDDPDLDQACFRVGTTRLWPAAELDAWMERQVAKGQPKKREAA